ncbi:MAG: hypothetical protein AUH92_06825 [Acidobacteria bacterium 13_1_40CM_4_69_4]|nr:MAG: hypothetical protein AUH92_06825 [Acidobacteria bacterium 13_1_40CM_4_69_4]
MTAPPRVPVALTRAQRLERLGGAVLLSVVLGTSFLLPPLRPLPLDACLLHRLTGLPCLTCGLSRAVCLFARGRWLDSLSLHPAGWLAFLSLLGALLWMGAEALAARELAPRPRARLLAGVLWCGAVLSACGWAARLAGG